MRDVQRFAAAVLFAVFALGALVGYGLAPGRADVTALRGEVAELQAKSVFDELALRNAKRAIQHLEADAVAKADTARAAVRAYAAPRGRVTIAGPFVIDTAGPAADTLSTDPRVAALLAKADTAIAALEADAAAAWRLAGAEREAREIAERRMAVQDTIIAKQDTLIRRLEARRAPRLGFKSGVVAGAGLAAALVWLAGGLAR
jgi:hypothetical protein